MKANELRIGNLVAFGIDNSWKVITLSEIDIGALVHYHKNTGKAHSPLYKGIPLTADRLKRFRWNEKSPGEWHLKGFSSFILSKASGGGESFTALHPIEKGAYVVKMNILHVHELQNLYFALMDREMKITSPTS